MFGDRVKLLGRTFERMADCCLKTRIQGSHSTARGV